MRRRRGMTLVEVLAGLAILGSLLVAILAAKGRFTRQWAEGKDRLVAVQLADGLLKQWWSADLDDLPRNGEGRFTGEASGLPDSGDWSWRTVTQQREELEGLDAEVVRLELFKDADDEPELAVEFVVPLLPEEEAETRR